MFQSSAGKNKLAKHVDDVWDLWHGFKLPQTYSVTHVITPTQVFACSSVRSHALESCWCRSHWELVLLLPDGVCSVCVWLLLWCRFFLFFLICAVAYTCGRLALFSSECFSRLQPLAGSTSRRPKTLFTTSYDFWERNGISQTDLISAHHNQRVCKYHSDIDLNCRNENVWKLSVVQMFDFWQKQWFFSLPIVRSYAAHLSC